MTVRLDSMLETVELPARVANLDSSLTNVDAEALSHDDNEIIWVKCPPVTCSISPATELSSDVGAGDTGSVSEEEGAVRARRESRDKSSWGSSTASRVSNPSYDNFRVMRKKLVST